MKSTAVDESLFSMNQQFCSRENQLLQIATTEWEIYINMIYFFWNNDLSLCLSVLILEMLGKV